MVSLAWILGGVECIQHVGNGYALLLAEEFLQWMLYE
jgi:hypothetical protein